MVPPETERGAEKEVSRLTGCREGSGRAILTAAKVDRNYNLKERICCRFAAHGKPVNPRRNYLLRLAAAQGAGSV
jgi:hypothetical protein